MGRKGLAEKAVCEFERAAGNNVKLERVRHVDRVGQGHVSSGRVTSMVARAWTSTS